MSLNDEFVAILPPLWVRTFSRLATQKLLTGDDSDPWHEIASRWLSHCIEVGDREGIQSAQRLLVLAIERRTPEQVAAIEEARGLLH